jgi:hypothetical protein
MHTLSIGIQEDTVYESALEAVLYTVSSCLFRPYDNCHYFIGKLRSP